MQWCEMPKSDMDRLVSKESAAQIHVVFMGQGLQPEALEQRRLKGDYAKIVAFRPTGELTYEWVLAVGMLTSGYLFYWRSRLHCTISQHRHSPVRKAAPRLLGTCTMIQSLPQDYTCCA